MATKSRVADHVCKLEFPELRRGLAPGRPLDVAQSPNLMDPIRLRSNEEPLGSRGCGTPIDHELPAPQRKESEAFRTLAPGSAPTDVRPQTDRG
jgi:hypothetical protein